MLEAIWSTTNDFPYRAHHRQLRLKHDRERRHTVLSHHLDLDCPNATTRRTTRAERGAIGAMIGLSALIVVLALQSERTVSGQGLTGSGESDATPRAVSVTGQ